MAPNGSRDNQGYTIPETYGPSRLMCPPPQKGGVPRTSLPIPAPLRRLPERCHGPRNEGPWKKYIGPHVRRMIRKHPTVPKTPEARRWYEVEKPQNGTTKPWGRTPGKIPKPANALKTTKKTLQRNDGCPWKLQWRRVPEITIATNKGKDTKMRIQEKTGWLTVDLESGSDPLQ